jgi:hypothetical protein
MGTSKQRLLAWSLTLALFATSLPRGFSQTDDASTFDPNDPNAAYLFGFPFGKCDDYRCGSSPYEPLKSSDELLSNGNYRVCFKFVDVGCQPGNVCCESILDLMVKIEFMAGT